MRLGKAAIGIVLAVSVATCNRGSSSRESGLARTAIIESVTATATGTGTQVGDEPIETQDDSASDDPVGGEPGPADAIVALPVTPNSLFVKGTDGGETCAAVSFKVTAQNQPLPTVNVNVTISPSTNVPDSGTLSVAVAQSNAEGIATTTYCSGVSETKVSIVAKVNRLQANSAEITVGRKPLYSLQFLKSDIPIVGAEGEGAPPAAGGEGGTGAAKGAINGTIRLNLFDSGPSDCTKIYFILKQGDQPFAAQTVEFRSQQDFPKGAKLANRDSTGTTATSNATGKKYATYTATSNDQGELVVPVCAGLEIGSILITGYWTGDDKKEYSAQAPVIQINSGLTYYSNMTLTYDPTNAKTLRGAFNNNVKHIQPFWVKLGARGDGDPILDYPVAVISEFGEVVLENGGLPSSAEGTVKFTVEAAHLDNYRPYQKLLFDHPLAQTRCDPVELSKVIENNLEYSKLRMNWRSTVVYMVRGQEAFHDANRNGIYDTGGDGFWDKNQNGFYDSKDVLTYDGGAPGFQIKGEWFIDLPSPFIDVDENGLYESDVDILLGDQYVAPNGKRDADTLIWKYDYLPIYVGTSPIAMLRAEIKKAPNFGDVTDTKGKAWFDLQDSVDLRGGNTTVLFNNPLLSDFYSGSTDSIYANGGVASFYLFAHDICGNPPAGDTKVKIGIENIVEKVGDRAVTGHIYMQAGDNALDPRRRLFSSATGSNEATINFNASEHPAADYGYPFEFYIKIAPCMNICSGKLKTFGTYCSGKSVLISVTVDTDTINRNVTVPQTKTCECLDTEAFDYSTGACFDPTL